MNLWTFYGRLVAMAREVDPDFPRFDHACFVEALVELGDMLWEARRPYVKGFRDEEYRATLTPRERLWHWLLRTVWWGSYGSGTLWPTGVECGHYDPATPGVPAPVPAAEEILGGPAIKIAFAEDEAARVARCRWVEQWTIETECRRREKQEETTP